MFVAFFLLNEGVRLHQGREWIFAKDLNPYLIMFHIKSGQEIKDSLLLHQLLDLCNITGALSLEILVVIKLLPWVAQPIIVLSNI